MIADAAVPAPSHAAPPAAVHLTCPECGYDLRGIDSDRCPECGWLVDRTLVARSQLPWTYRGREIGRWAAYWRTVRIGTWRHRKLAAEVARPVEESDARRFASVTALLAGVPTALAMLAVMIADGGTNFLNPLSDAQGRAWTGNSVPPAADLMLPFAAGVTRWAVPPLAFLAFWWLAVRVPRVWMPGGEFDADRRDRAAALACYTAAPFAFVPLALVAGAGALLVEWLNDAGRDVSFDALYVALRFTGWLVVVICFGMSWLAALRLQSRTLRVSLGRTLVTAVAIPLTWLTCAALAFGLMPWIAGLLWLMFDSVRS